MALHMSNATSFSKNCITFEPEDFLHLNTTKTRQNRYVFVAAHIFVTGNNSETPIVVTTVEDFKATYFLVANEPKTVCEFYVDKIYKGSVQKEPCIININMSKNTGHLYRFI